jgi:hypothetical protein
VLRNPQKARLAAEIDELDAMVGGLPSTGPPVEARELSTAQAYLEAARGSIRRDPDTGWQHAFHAREQIVRCLPDERILALAQTLRVEVRDKGKLTRWRRAAIDDQLTDLRPDTALPLTPAQREAYAEALRLRDQGLTNQYWRLRIVRHHQFLLMLFGGPVLAITIALFAFSADRFSDPVWQTGAYPCLLSVLLGMLGATVSAAQRSTTVPPQRITEQFASDIASFSRLPIGAVAGLTVWLFSVAAVQDMASFNAANMFLAAFGAGFAERLVVQGANTSVLGSVESPPYPDGDGGQSSDSTRHGRRRT